MATPPVFIARQSLGASLLRSVAWALAIALAWGAAGSLVAAEPATATDAETRLVAVGALSATSMVTTQAFLGVVADGLVEGLYKKAEEVEPDLNRVVSSLVGSLKAVEQVRNQKLTDADRTFLDEIKQVFTLQQTEAQALVAFARAKDQAELRRWKAAHEAAQKKIDALTGHGEEPHVLFENVKEKLNPALQAQFVSFRVQYPETWKIDVGTGSGDGAAFLQATSWAKENGKSLLREQFIAGPLLLKAAPTPENELELLKEKVADLVGQLKEKHPRFRKTSEGPLNLGKLPGYGFEFTDLEQKTGADDTAVFGRIILFPPSVTKQPHGLMITILGTVRTAGLHEQAELGTKGELPVLLESFALGPTPAPIAPPR